MTSEIPHIVGLRRTSTYERIFYGEGDDITYVPSRKSFVMDILQAAFGGRLHKFNPTNIFVATWEIEVAKYYSIQKRIL